MIMQETALDIEYVIRRGGGGLKLIASSAI